MKKTVFILFIISSLMSFSFFLLGALDPVESLIEQHQDDDEEENADELPSLFLFGDKTGVEVYSVLAYGGQSNLICEPAELDEVIELSRGHPSDDQTVLNMSLPRIREAMSQMCLIRPGDDVLAMGAGWQRVLRVKDFVVRRDSSTCPLDPPYSLWMNFEQELEETPLLFSTDPEFKEGPNHFRRLEDLVVVPLGDMAREQIKKQLPLLTEYELTVYSIEASNCSRLILAKRRTVSSDDDALTNEALFWEAKGRVDKLWEEKVSVRKGSGHIKIEGIWDYNGDNRIDLFLTGDHERCRYRVLFEGRDEGFEPMDVPNKPCGC